MEDTLNFKKHISKLCVEVKQQSAVIMRSFKTRDIVTMKTLWLHLIQPKLAYCLQI